MGNLQPPGVEQARSSSSTRKPIESKTAEKPSNSPSAQSDTEGNHWLDEDGLVWWDGENDPENPYNWPNWQKYTIGGLISLVTFVTPLASSIFAPGVQDLMIDFKSSNTELAAFVVSVYVLGFAVGPLVLAPLSEMYGRVPVYHVCNVCFVAFTVACAVAPSLDALIVFCFFAGSFGSAPPHKRRRQYSRYLFSGEARGCYGCLQHRPVAWPHHWTCCWGLLDRCKGLAMGLLGRRHSERHYFCRNALTDAGELCSHHSGSEGCTLTQRDWQHIPSLKTGYRLHSSRALQTIHCPPNQVANILSYLHSLRLIHSCDIWLPIYPLHVCPLRLQKVVQL